MGTDNIVVRRARQHNLKNVTVTIPRNALVVVTGISGSGKSSLAFDTIYAEGQRRYVESLSAYARQFLGQMDKPDVEHIEGLSPAISIDQKATSHNPRSTVGTVTEIHDYLRLLYARVGQPHCPTCGRVISGQTVDQMVDQLLELPEGTRFQVLAPSVRDRKGEHEKLFDDIRRAGFVRVRVDGEVCLLEDAPPLDRNRRHTVEIVVDRLVMQKDLANRLADSLATALSWGDGLAIIDVIDGEDITLSEHMACPDCGFSLEELTPRMFSFNSPQGACRECDGLGQNLVVDQDMVIPDRSMTLEEGAVAPWSRGEYYPQLLAAACAHWDIPMDVPVSELDPSALDIILGGGGDEKMLFVYRNRYGRSRRRHRIFEGVIHNLTRRHRESSSESARSFIEEFMVHRPCPSCGGARLRPEILAVTVGDKNIAEVSSMSIRDAHRFFARLRLSGSDAVVARQILREVQKRLKFLINVGLSYLTLSRAAATLAGGESQRIRLATQIGSGLVGVLYILDEPSVGLHQRDNRRLLDTLASLRDLGNTVIVVEHDEETILRADHVIDIGPGAGDSGGQVVAEGTPREIMDCPDSITGQYLSGERQIPTPRERRRPGAKWLVVRGAREHNLKAIDVEIPLGLFVGVTGVSGSGKSTLVHDILYRQLAHDLNRAHYPAGRHDGILGGEHLSKVVEIDQSPIGRTPRSNPATYTGTFDFIREVFASTPEARMRGYEKGRFSFNLKGGRCEACRGQGIVKIEMHFLPDIYVPCEVCAGRRYNRETLEVRYKGATIADILEMTVDEASRFFSDIPRIADHLETLRDVGLGYIKLGQPATTLSGGEAQRVKLASELKRRSNGDTLYLLDEPTTGLHSADIHQLLKVLQRLVDEGATVVIIEHNLDVIKSVDHIIDLGPEGGEDGGRIVAVGSPEEVAAAGESHTGRYLRDLLLRSLPKDDLVGVGGELPEVSSCE
ncbi:MAG: excinuclease ABC subunit UvrA [Bacillota bacterium]